MNLQFKPAAYKYKNVPAEPDLIGTCRRLPSRVLKFQGRDQERRVVQCASAPAATIVVVLSPNISAVAQERPHSCSEYTYWLELLIMPTHFRAPWVREILENRFERLIYSSKSSSRTTIALGYKYHQISNAYLEDQDPDWIPTRC